MKNGKKVNDNLIFNHICRESKFRQQTTIIEEMVKTLKPLGKLSTKTTKEEPTIR